MEKSSYTEGRKLYCVYYPKMPYVTELMVPIVYGHCRKLFETVAFFSLLTSYFLVISF